MRTRKKLLGSLVVLLVAWIIIDLNYPFKKDITRINATETSSMEALMRRSYYEKRPVKLFLQSSALMRKEFQFPFWRSNQVAWYAAKAAFAFKDGKNRDDYKKALPYLKNYYRQINDLSARHFNADSAATSELEWWIIRRERAIHPPAEWESCLAMNASIMYHIPEEEFRDYAHLRAEAMLLRDAKGNAIRDEDWRQIRELLLKAWQSFAAAVSKTGNGQAGDRMNQSSEYLKQIQEIFTPVNNNWLALSRQRSCVRHSPADGYQHPWRLPMDVYSLIKDQ